MWTSFTDFEVLLRSGNTQFSDIFSENSGNLGHGEEQGEQRSPGGAQGDLPNVESG